MGNFSTTTESLEFLKNRFKEYYKKSNIELPDRFGKREFAFVFFGGRGMYRHLSFDKKRTFSNFVKEKSPAHAYYSTAYYQKPDASTMQEKGWMGAELIFDLDSDHLPNAERYSYTQQLELVKEEFKKLVNDFLICDFGFDEKHLELYFSGGRGYHCHVKDPKIMCLGSNERREIVDYITGRDLIESVLFHEQVTSTMKIRGKTVPTSKTLKMPKPTEAGWRGRISRGIIEIVSEIKNSKYPIEKLKEYGVKEKEAEKLLTDLSEERIKRIKEGNLDQTKTIRRFFLNNALRKTAVMMGAGETDEPVTCDVKRLIRLPGSLHGKTAFKVTKINIDQLDDFNPLTDTIAISDKSVEIELDVPFQIELKGEKFDLEKGKQDVPTYLATFLIGQKVANIV